MSWLPGPVKGLFVYLDLILNRYRRHLVGWEVSASEAAAAAAVVGRAVLTDRCVDPPLGVHADNGSPMTGETWLATRYRLGITPS